MCKVREEIEKETRIYIHNDLDNAADHLKNGALRVVEREEPGSALHILGALIVYAFTLEAKINFLGEKLIDGWRERDPYHIKLGKVLDACGLDYNESSRPQSNFKKLKEFRDIVAHGKPIEKFEKYEKITNRNEEEEIDLGEPSPHEPYCNVEFLTEVDEDIETFWQQALEAKGIEEYETLTRFSGGRKYVESQ